MIKARQLCPASQEDLRRRVVAAVEAGQDQAAAAKVFGVGLRSVSRWVTTFRRNGNRGLTARKRGRRPHEQKALDARQQARLRRAVQGKYPDQLALPGLVWTRGQVGELVQRWFDAPAPRPRLTAEQRRESILIAATQVFAEHGFRRGKVSEVAVRMGVSEPVVFQNFGTKAALFRAVLDQAATTATTACAVLATAIQHRVPVSQWLAAALSPGHVEQFHAPGSLGAVFAEAAGLTGDPDVGEESRRTIQRIGTALAALIAHGQQVGDIRADVDADAVAWWVMSLLSGRTFRTAVAPNPPEVEARLAAMTLRLIAT